MNRIFISCLIIGLSSPIYTSDNTTNKPYRQCCPDPESPVVDLDNSDCFSVDEDNNKTSPWNIPCEYERFMVNERDDNIQFNEETGEFHLDGNTVNEVFCRGETYLKAKNSEEHEQVTMYLVCLTENKSIIFYQIKAVLLLISVFFIVLTLLVYWKIPGLRETQDKVTCITIACLAMFFFLLALVQLFTFVIYDHAYWLCEPSALAIYFFGISYFVWLTVVMGNVWKSCVLPKWNIKESTWYMLCHIYGWSIPFILLILVATAHYTDHHLSPKFGEYSCWFQDIRLQWIYFYSVICICLSINIFLFCSSIYQIQKYGNAMNSDRNQMLRAKCMLYLRLFILGGITWIIEVLAVTVSGEVFKLFLDIVNALHGLLIFLILIVWRPKIKSLIGGKKIFCIKFPESWANDRELAEETEFMHTAAIRQS